MSNKMKNMRAALLFFLVAVISLSVSAQNVTVTGTVTDKTGETVIGASVVEKGNAGNGTITDIDGNFMLEVPVGGKLQFSFIGYKEQVVPIKKGISLNIVLEEDSQMLGEVEVVAYGAQKKVSITGAISSMKGDDLLKTPAGSISNILSGQVPYIPRMRKVSRHFNFLISGMRLNSFPFMS